MTTQPTSWDGPDGVIERAKRASGDLGALIAHVERAIVPERYEWTLRMDPPDPRSANARPGYFANIYPGGTRSGGPRCHATGPSPWEALNRAFALWSAAKAEGRLMVSRRP